MVAKKEFVVATFNLEYETFVVYAVLFAIFTDVYPSHKI